MPKRTKAWPGGYRPDRADMLALRRRHWVCRFKLARQPTLRALVRNRLAMGWSLEQIADRLAREDAPMRISHESIYRFVYHRAAQKDYWNRLLPMRKGRRGRLRRGGVSPVHHIKRRTPIRLRPAAIDNRTQAGHWEADLMLFAKYGQVVLVAHERKSRLLIANRQPSKAAVPVAKTLIRLFKPLPECLRQSITFDNGTEFARHYLLTEKFNMKTFFCDPYAPCKRRRRKRYPQNETAIQHAEEMSRLPNTRRSIFQLALTVALQM
ncbi:MAG: IS30 family transposase [Proteobacteria bacterium]|nr:IS30 family transposase [Pseudomonadota bacterium]